MFVIDGRAISSRLGNGRRLGGRRLGGRRLGGQRLGAREHVFRDIDPDEPSNMQSLLALELSQAAPQSFCLKDVVSANL